MYNTPLEYVWLFMQNDWMAPSMGTLNEKVARSVHARHQSMISLATSWSILFHLDCCTLRPISY